MRPPSPPTRIMWYGDPSALKREREIWGGSQVRQRVWCCAVDALAAELSCYTITLTLTLTLTLTCNDLCQFLRSQRRR
jgi:hypothetical protein